MLIDSHIHLSHPRFSQTFRYLTYHQADDSYAISEGSLDELVEAIRTQGVHAVIEPAIDLASNKRLLALAERYPGWLYPAIGLHPTRTHLAERKDRSLLKSMADRNKIVAIGETGLDFHYPRREQHRLCQIRWFVFQILLAHERKLPLILHIRKADRTALPILWLFRRKLHGGAAHCFHGNLKKANAFLKLGFHLGIGGTLLQSGPDGETLCETIKTIPLDRILLETDAPYVHPTCDAVSSGKKRAKINNTPLILPAVARRIADLKGLSTEIIMQKTSENARTLFKICALSQKKL